MKTPIFTGSGLAMITPMHADGSVNYAEIDRIVADWVKNHPAEYDFTAEDGFGHHFWVIDD